jgi:hypothetical protein
MHTPDMLRSQNTMHCIHPHLLWFWNIYQGGTLRHHSIDPSQPNDIPDSTLALVLALGLVVLEWVLEMVLEWVQVWEILG